MNSIMLVEDEKWVRTAIRKVIEKTNLSFEVVKEASNGMEALDWLKEHQVDLVFTDIRMPVMDGLTLTKQIREDKINTDVVIISGHDEFNYAHQAIRSGVYDYMLKPVEQEDMEKFLIKWLKRVDEAASQENIEEVPVEELSTVEQALRFIDQAMPGDVSLTETAKAVHLNASYLSQLFKQETGKNFKDYVMELKMKESSKLLKHTSLRISEVAERLGYADLAYFTNSFKKHFGQTPSKFRDEHKQ